MRAYRALRASLRAACECLTMSKQAKGTRCAKGARQTRPVVIKPASGRKFRVSGLKSPKGDQWVQVQCRSDVAFAPFSDFVGNGSEAAKRLANSGVVTIGREWPAVRDAVATLSWFPSKPLIEQPGWSGAHFALADGRVFSPPGSNQPIVLFGVNQFKCAHAGSPKGWKNGICRPLADQQLCAFMMMVPFAAPLLGLTDRIGNFGFELVGDGGTGKSTLQQLMATVPGGAMPSAPGHYWVDCNTTANALEPTMMAHSDQVIIMDEQALFAGGATDRARASSMKELVFKLAAGSSKARFPAGQQTEHRLIYVMSSNKSLEQTLGGDDAAVAAAAADRLITLNIEERRYGIFDYVPAQWQSASAFAEALKKTAAEHYGLAFPRFIQRLVNRRARDERKLRKRVSTRLEEFRRAAGVDPNDGSALRVVDAFGLCYAGGALAQQFKVLPRTFDCLRAAVTCYNLYREDAHWLQPLPHRLRRLSKDPHVVDLDNGLPRLSNTDLYAVAAFLKTTKTKRREILFLQASRDRFFPDFDALKRDPANGGLFKSEKGRDTVRRRIRKGKGKEAVYRFYLPPDAPDDDDDNDDEIG